MPVWALKNLPANELMRQKLPPAIDNSSSTSVFVALPGILIIALLICAPATMAGGKYWQASDLEEMHFAKHGCSKGEEIPFRVRLALTPEQKEKGLQRRRMKHPDKGMLFLWDDSRPRIMWMKDTHVPLDMMFVGRNGRIFQIEPDREPLSLERVISNKPARAVFEADGGTAKKLGLKIGDYIIHRAFPGALDCL